MRKEIRELLQSGLVHPLAQSFQRLTFHFIAETQLGLRVARNEICRENVWRDSDALVIVGHQPGKSSRIRVGLPRDQAELTEHLRRLLNILSQQSEDDEAMIPNSQRGIHHHLLADFDLARALDLESIYRAISEHAAVIRDKRQRLTGYLEVLKTETLRLSTDETELCTSDVGGQITFTVDDEVSGTSGVGKRSLTAAQLGLLASRTGDAVSEADTYCNVPGTKGEIQPVDYTAILSPVAFHDLVRTMLIYGLFDKRKIDEGRTYLSHALSSLTFDPKLLLQVSRRLGEIDLQHIDMPFNEHGVACEDLSVIQNGKLNDLFVEAFWAKRHGLTETFSQGFLPPILCDFEPGGDTALFESIEDLIADTKRGVFIADTWYLRMVSEMDGVITGMTRDGFFLIEDGKLVKPLMHMRWHENPFKVLGRISGATSAKQLCGMSRLAGPSRGSLAAMPAVRIEDFHFSSVSKF